MIILGIILAILGFLIGFWLLEVAGVILVVVGLMFLIAGRTGRPVGGRAHWW
jgi:hypothetical protein